MTAVASMGLACLQHGKDATKPMTQLTKQISTSSAEVSAVCMPSQRFSMNLTGVGQVKIAALRGVSMIGQHVDEPDKLLPFVGTIGALVFKSTKERNFALRDSAKAALAWLLQVCYQCFSL